MNTLDTLTAPLAIAMWDSTWLRRRYRGGGFEDWDRTLAALTDRGYNAVRIDAFPHLIAADGQGRVTEVFKDVPDHHPNFYGFGMWGTQWTQYLRPREALSAFMRACERHGVRVVLTTWLKPTADRRNEQLVGAEDIVRVWDETLRFLDENALLGNVVWVDPLNELPVGFCMPWYHATLRLQGMPAEQGKAYTARQRDFMRSFVDAIFSGLKRRWPALVFGGSVTHGEPRNEALDFSVMDLIDSHIWINFCPAFIEGSDYWRTIGLHGHPDHLFRREAAAGDSYAGGSFRLIPQDVDYDVVNAALRKRWTDRRTEWASWLNQASADTAALGRRHGVPVGNTEGWGMVLWTEHPLLDWTIQTEAAEIGAQAGAANGYLFNCSANFCHPHHIGYWEDAGWHRGVTDTIKAGRPARA